MEPFFQVVTLCFAGCFVIFAWAVLKWLNSLQGDVDQIRWSLANAHEKANAANAKADGLCSGAIIPASRHTPER